MSKTKTKAPEDNVGEDSVVEETVEEMKNTVVEDNRALVVAVVTIDANGKWTVQDGQQLFGEDQVAHPLTEDIFSNLAKQIAKELEVQDLVRAVKREFAR